jgi:hypothetical protein
MLGHLYVYLSNFMVVVLKHGWLVQLGRHIAIWVWMCCVNDMGLYLNSSVHLFSDKWNNVQGISAICILQMWFFYLPLEQFIHFCKSSVSFKMCICRNYFLHFSISMHLLQDTPSFCFIMATHYSEKMIERKFHCIPGSWRMRITSTKRHEGRLQKGIT